MDSAELIARLNQAANTIALVNGDGAVIDLLRAAAAALSTQQAENERLQASEMKMARCINRYVEKQQFEFRAELHDRMGTVTGLRHRAISDLGRLQSAGEMMATSGDTGTSIAQTPETTIGDSDCGSGTPMTHATVPFVEFPKIARLTREIVVSEKIDGTNGCVYIGEDGYTIRFGSRTRWLSAVDDNFGFWRWCNEHTDELLTLGPGTHFGEWWGSGIQRRYGQDRKRFSLFNTHRWSETRPACCDVVPVLYAGMMDEAVITGCLLRLETEGSAAAPGFMNPEGVIVYHTAARIYFKKTIHKDAEWKGKAA